MTSQQFVSAIRREVLDANLKMYLEDFQIPAASHWPKMTKLYESLDKEQQRQFIESIRQVMVDTLSNVFGILDGSTLLEDHRDYFHLTYAAEPEEINGELQDIFLSIETQ